VTRLLDTAVAQEDLGVSHEWSLRRVTLADGRRVFVKQARRPIDGLFAAESAGLRWLAEAAEPAEPG
jgi:fructosamine-3-kinase